jgi:acyl-CoA thioester hydrolase
MLQSLSSRITSHNYLTTLSTHTNECVIEASPGRNCFHGRLNDVAVELTDYLRQVVPMIKLSDMLELRVRYSETDQMGTFYNSRALEWFECGRSELMRRRLGMSYAALESQGVFLPLVEAHLEFLGGAKYDDLLQIESVVELEGRARLRFEVKINHTGTNRLIVRGYTIHAFTDRAAKPIRPPRWFLEKLAQATDTQTNSQRQA